VFGLYAFRLCAWTLCLDSMGLDSVLRLYWFRLCAWADLGSKLPIFEFISIFCFIYDGLPKIFRLRQISFNYPSI
jgi:hypothetical protein